MGKLIKRLSFYVMYNTKLITKLLVSFAILILTPLILLTVFSYRNTANTLMHQFEFSSEQVLHQSSVNLNQIIYNINTFANKMAFNTEIAKIYRHNKNSLLESYENYHDLVEKFRTIRAGNDQITSIEIFTSGKYTLNERGSTADISFVNIDNSYAKELNRLLESNQGETLWLTPDEVKSITQKTDDNHMLAAKYMYCEPSNIRIGIMTISLNQEIIDNIMKDSTLLPNGLTIMMDTCGKVMAVSNEELLEEYSIPTEVLLQERKDASQTVSTETGVYFINSTKLENVGWILVSVVPNREILKTSISSQRSLIIITIIISLFFLAFAVLFSKLLSKRILSLANAMKKVHLGNYTLISSNGGTDEVSELIDSYNYLLGKINAYADSQVKTVSQLKSQQIKALQAEINPHFLYNTLDLLNWIALDYDAYEISEIVTLLSKFYKQSLNKGVDIISTEDAIRHTEIYIKLQNFRFENPVILELNIAPEIYGYRILNLLLQPIVENAVMHGILKKHIPDGKITITGTMTADRLMHFEITDNGVGMDQEQIAALTDTSVPDTVSSFSSHGYGIKNVIERIKLYYGDEYGLTFESTPDIGTTVTIEIPAR